MKEWVSPRTEQIYAETERDRDALRQGLSLAIELLNLKSWNSTNFGNGEPKTFLSIPVRYAVLSGEFSPASREVF